MNIWIPIEFQIRLETVLSCNFKDLFSAPKNDSSILFFKTCKPIKGTMGTAQNWRNPLQTEGYSDFPEIMHRIPSFPMIILQIITI